MKDVKQPPNTIGGYIKNILLFLVKFSVHITIYFVTGIAVISYITLILFLFCPYSFPWWFGVYTIAACLIFFTYNNLSPKAYLIACFGVTILNYIIILYFYPKIFMLK